MLPVSRFLSPLALAASLTCFGAHAQQSPILEDLSLTSSELYPSVVSKSVAESTGSFAAVEAAPVGLPPNIHFGVVVHGLSHHFTKRAGGKNWNQTNTGLGLRMEWSPEFAAQVGSYDNSIDKQSAYALVDWTPLEALGMRFGGFAGFVNGYDTATSKGVMPGAGLLARAPLPIGHSSLALRFFPRVKQTGTALIALEASFGF